jgi:periplasmic divalent cation tolerance protein
MSSSSQAASPPPTALAAADAAAAAAAAADDLAVGYITHRPGPESAAFAAALVEAGLAACVNIVPGVTSVYRWQGRTETDAEVLLILKTRLSLRGALCAFLAARHPYDVPELVLLPVAGGHAPYLAWVRDNTTPRPAPATAAPAATADAATLTPAHAE